MNVQELMKKAKTLQEEMMSKKTKIDETVFSNENQVVKIEMNGKRELLSFKLKEGYREMDTDLLEDLILLAFKETTSNIYDKYEEEMGQFADIADTF